MDLDDAAQMIADAKTFALRNELPLADNCRRPFLCLRSLKREARQRGGHVCAPAEKSRWQAVYVAAGPRHSVDRVVAKAALHIAELPELIPPDRTSLVVEEAGVGEAHLFLGREAVGGAGALSVQRRDRRRGRPRQRITSYQGAGDTCGIHSSRDDHVLHFWRLAQGRRV